jgi:Putative Actinobacterial Holin-X, holin superfamily III
MEGATERPPSRPIGIRGSVSQVVAHLRALSQLERELARREMARKGATGGTGAGLFVGAGILALFALGFGLAAIAAGLALVVDWWLALLIVFAALVVVVAVLVLVGRTMIRKTVPLKPEQAIEEARLTAEALRGRRAG